MLQIGRFSFIPKVIPTLATVTLLPILLLLGNWQLHRAAEKETLQKAYEIQSKAVPLTLNQLTNNVEKMRYHPVQLTGRYDNQHQFLLDNQFYQHQVGYYVLTPLILPASNKVILINRGWVPANIDRRQLPVLAQVKDTVNLQGMIRPLDKKSFILGTKLEKPNWPLRIEKIDLNYLQQVSDYSFYPFVVLLNANQPDGFARDWEPVNLNPAKNYGYAFQWFSLALTLLIIFIVLNTHRKR